MAASDITFAVGDGARRMISASEAAALRVESAQLRGRPRPWWRQWFR